MDTVERSKAVGRIMEERCAGLDESPSRMFKGAREMYNLWDCSSRLKVG